MSRLNKEKPKDGFDAHLFIPRKEILMRYLLSDKLISNEKLKEDFKRNAFYRDLKNISLPFVNRNVYSSESMNITPKY